MITLNFWRLQFCCLEVHAFPLISVLFLRVLFLILFLEQFVVIIVLTLGETYVMDLIVMDLTK